MPALRGQMNRCGKSLFQLGARPQRLKAAIYNKAVIAARCSYVALKIRRYSRCGHGVYTSTVANFPLRPLPPVTITCPDSNIVALCPLRGALIFPVRSHSPVTGL